MSAALNAPGPAAQSLNATGARMMTVLTRDGTNRLFSPLSAYGALTLLLNGASGATEQVVRRAMQLPAGSLSTDNEAISTLFHDIGGKETAMANAIFAPPGTEIGQSYKQDVAHYFGATIEPLVDDGPAGVRQVNEWVDRSTKHRIGKLLDHLEKGDLVLANAITFDGKWQTPFDKSMTVSKTFHAYSGVQDVPTMGRTGRMRYGKTSLGEELELPYEGGRFAMRIMLPAAGDPAKMLGASNTTPMMARQVDLQLPKFSFSDSMDLKAALTAIGLGSLYHGGEFGRLVPARPAYKIGQAIQKTWIEVDEEGTKAAAVTGITMRALAVMPQTTISFHVDRPFAFEIVHTATGAVLFSGIVYKINT